MTDRVRILLAATGLFYQGRIRLLEQHEVDALRLQAEQLLPRGDELARAITAFATQWEAVRRDPAGTRAAAEELGRNVDRLTRNDPPDLHRADIHG